MADQLKAGPAGSTRGAAPPIEAPRRATASCCETRHNGNATTESDSIRQLAHSEFPDDLLKPGSRIYVQGCSGESPVWQRWLLHHADQLHDLHFAGVLIPGVNRFDYSALGERCTLEVIFLQPAFRDGYRAGRIRYLPLTYSNTIHYYRRGPTFDLALLQVSAPNHRGEYSLGTSADFAPTVLENCRRVAVHVNPEMPFTDGPVLPASRVDAVLEAQAPLLQFPDETPSAALAQAAGHLVTLINDGDAVQFGLGKLQQAACEALQDHRGLRIHSGMISDPILPLLERGAVSAVTTGTAIGTDRLYRRCQEPPIRFAPVASTHAATTLATVSPLKCINAVMEIDLLGQGNSEWLGSGQISGCGGLMDFGRGCRQHPKGAFILATPATARGGQVSRIVPRLSGHSVSVTRQDCDFLVTEHGIADLRHKTPDEKAQALIGVAAPAFRDALAKAWNDDIAPAL